MQNLYDLERIFELEQLSREEQMRHERGEQTWQNRGEGPSAWLAAIAALLALFRLG